MAVIFHLNEQVCNHPELFERADVVAPFSFAVFGRSGRPMRDGDSMSLYYSTRNPIEFLIPQLFYLDGGLPISDSRTSSLTRMFNIWSADWIHKSLYDEGESTPFQ